MNNLFKKNLGIDISSVLIPKKGINLSKWAVVACDQYTSEPEYWEEAQEIISDSPSTLNLVFPEVYLERESEDKKDLRIKNINDTMKNYIEEGLFEDVSNSLIYIERESDGKVRNGIVLAVDLENYDFSKDSQSLIRATEGTIIDRLPPRIKVRENASLELPHIMLLIDDPEKTVIEPICNNKSNYEKIYDFNLMLNGGSLRGYKISDNTTLEKIYNALSKLKSEDNFKNKYNTDESKGVLFFAVGDGNHSLATAKSCWDKLKATLPINEQENHPARFALVEVVNVHDEGLIFEPIHRVLFNVNTQNLLDSFKKYYESEGLTSGCSYVDNFNDCPKNTETKHIIPFVFDSKYGYLYIENPKCRLDVGSLQVFLDEYLKNNKNTSIDYVHGDDVTIRLGKEKGNMGFLLSKMNKDDLFKTVIWDGALPRKTFSMGEANEKRYYLECRKIR